MFIPSRCTFTLFQVVRRLQSSLSPSACFFPEWEQADVFMEHLVPFCIVPNNATSPAQPEKIAKNLKKKNKKRPKLNFKILNSRFCDLLDSIPSVRSSVYCWEANLCTWNISLIFKTQQKDHLGVWDHTLQQAQGRQTISLVQNPTAHMEPTARQGPY